MNCYSSLVTKLGRQVSGPAKHPCLRSVMLGATSSTHQQRQARNPGEFISTKVGIIPFIQFNKMKHILLCGL